jgi:hypothetical protein
MKFSWPIVLGCAAGLLSQLPAVWELRHRFFAGGNDFLSFYAGARLAGTPGMYNHDRLRDEQLASAGMTGPTILAYYRPPHFAVLLRPLARLPYRTAYAVWQLLSIAAFGGFLVLWQSPLPITFLFACLSFPLFAGFLNAQDITHLLLWIALSAWLQKRNKSFLAGLVFSLCASKFHLFLLLPVLILGQRLRWFGCGLASGGAALLGLSFAVCGQHWPEELWTTLRHPTDSADAVQAVCLHGLFYGRPAAGLLECFFAATVIAAAWMIVRRSSFEYGLAATLLGSLLVSVHGHVQDAAILIPALLIVYFTGDKWARVLALVLLLPPGYILSLTRTAPWTAVIPVTALALLYAMAFRAVKEGTSKGGQVDLYSTLKAARALSVARNVEDPAPPRG